MLLERIQPDTLGEAEDEEGIASVAVELSRRVAIPAPRHLPRLRDRVEDWERQLHIDSTELDHPLSPRSLHTTLDCRAAGQGPRHLGSAIGTTGLADAASNAYDQVIVVGVTVVRVWKLTF